MSEYGGWSFYPLFCFEFFWYNFIVTQPQLEKFISYLQKNAWSVFGPVFATEKIEELSPFLAAHQASKTKKIGQISINAIRRPADLNLNGQLPVYSFKRFFVPEKERLFRYQGDKLKEEKSIYSESSRRALVGMNILDLKAVNLYDQVFEKDPYYQARRRDTLIVGYSLTPEITNNIFEHAYEENILEHLPFDIFLAEINPSTHPPIGGLAQGILPERSEAKSKAYKVFTGSIKGQRLLEHFGYKDYEHIQFSGPVKEGPPDARMERLRDRLKNHHNPKIWEELGKICIECGKCTLACPTCFCFRIDDQAQLEHKRGDHGASEGIRERCWDSCYYQEFSEVSGPDKPGQGKPKFLNSAASRIHFWYFHKFARIPDEFDFMGCVGCRRCATVCPVGIDIADVLDKIEKT